MLAAGLEGIEKEYELPEPITENVFHMSHEVREKRGIGTLPGSLAEAIKLAQKSELVKKVLGDHVFHTLLGNKKIEWDNYRAQVTECELSQYLPIL